MAIQMMMQKMGCSCCMHCRVFFALPSDYMTK